MLQNVDTFFVKLITFIIFCAVGVWAGLKVLSVWTDLQYSGRLVQWQLLDSEQKFRQIVDANENGVWVQAENGKYYLYSKLTCPLPCDTLLEQLIVLYSSREAEGPTL